MTNSTKQSEFENERKNTDVSLIAERIKATESLKQASNKSQTQTDRRLVEERAVADNKTASFREENDQLRNSSDSESSSRETRQLAKERKLTDEATVDERMQADLAIEKERDLADKMVGHVLDLERKITDQNLSEERASADTHILASSATLESEIADHSLTKAHLTSREELLAIVSHDLRNPVGTANSYAELILRMDGLDEKVRSHVSAIKRNTNTALRLIADLMEMERFSLHKWKFKFGQCSANELVHQTLQDFAYEAKEKQVHLVDATEALVTNFNSDHDRLMQVFSNVVGNALKFTPRNGLITLNALVVNGQVQFSVQDTGPGIPVSQQKKIFERFAQLESKDRTGLGLGLYISRTLIEALGGKVWLDSEEGKGSTFYFTVPLDSGPH